MKVYRVGGCVRDSLLGLAVKDRDYVVVGATPQQLQAQGYLAVGKDFPVFLHPQTKEEYALARTERKTAPGYSGFAFHASPEVSLEQDLQRRDLTINAMAQDEQGRLIDPYGGQADLQQRILRHVSSAFVEDPVRILRVARFAARFVPLGFRIAPETLALMTQMVHNGEVAALVSERVWQETERALGEDHPSRYFEVLRDCGALKILFPELDALFGVPQPAEHHPEIDTGVHTMMVLTQATRLSNDSKVRFAALLHDVGKGLTPPSEWPHHYNHEARGVALVTALCERLKVPGHYRDLARMVAEYHLHYHRIKELRPGTVLETLLGLDAFRRPERFEAFLLACEADARGRPGYETREFEQPRLFRRYFAAADQVNIPALVASGIRGEPLKQAIHQQRLDAIAGIKNDLH
ncbi:MAG: multifunctional CCA addition/repair protein [Gammaproteobacteria bacterium]|nr:multifunctional CCA addition/repair protein [Gammaproteobacteria bacterium]